MTGVGGKITVGCSTGRVGTIGVGLVWVGIGSGKGTGT